MSESTSVNPANYVEIGTPDPEAARRFYGSVFGWEFGAADGDYAPVNGNAGGLWNTADIGAEAWAVFYIEVTDIRAIVDAAVQAGAEVVRPIIDTGVIRFAHLSDPSGSRFGVWQRVETMPSDA
ncbi:putative enzyme related to lactoylglutathione lyase [Microbacterium sp. SORGH_AS 1204]|uniref:VOC family protein n=1 Tax=Microbacterium sp. SORGH_AS_1204 TaxID=3041785 RepID=UPI00278F8E59|nr:VOC family protein [Microbacterium sp. SORGH_AS_1204]MDQ1136611.1 putative enzyme related to lactoylglutathione lyase [Microbacterium sp. SORGH_AS_1204]